MIVDREMFCDCDEILLNKGGLFGFETDTVWGLGCLPDDKTAVDKIYEIKGRDRSKPLILMSNSLKNLTPYILEVPEYAKILIKKYFPGALTLIFKKSNKTKDFITSGQNTVGIRVPNHKGFWELCAKIPGNVLATTSLNYSGEPPAVNFDEAAAKFKETADIIEPEQGSLIQGVSSTVVLCTGVEPKVLRQGSVEI